MNRFKIILKKELKEVFRDKKSLTMMLIIPFMIPLIILGMSALFDMQMNKPVEEYNRIGFNYELTEVEKQIANELKINYQTKKDNELVDSYEKGELDLYIIKDDNHYVLNGSDNETTSYAMSLMKKYFGIYKEYLQQNILQSQNISPEKVINVITTEEKISEKENFYANYIVNYGFLFILMAITVSATYPATDTTAGEKERGTLETLLTFPLKSKDIILGKFMSVSLSSLLTGVISLVLLLVSLKIANDSFSIYEGVSLMLPLSAILYTFIVILAYSFLISCLCIAIAGKCKTFKESQSALTPLTFISFFPGMITFMVDIESSRIMSLIPFLNYTLLFEDIIIGKVDFISIFLMLVSTIIIIFVALKFIIMQYKSEKILF